MSHENVQKIAFIHDLAISILTTLWYNPRKTRGKNNWIAEID